MGKKVTFSQRKVVEDAWVENRIIPTSQAKEVEKHVGCMVDAALHKKFKVKVSSKGESVKTVLTKLIEKYCNEK